MSKHLVSRVSRAAAVTALTLAAAVGTAGPVGATSPEDHPIEVSLGADGIQAPDSAQGGLVSFRVRTDDKNGRQLQLLRPHDGVSVDQMLHDLADSFSPTGTTAAAGIRAVRTESDALGGALVTPDVHEQFTEEVTPGAVYLLDLTAFAADPTHPVVKQLNLVGTNGQSANQVRYDDGMVIEHDEAAGPRFQTEAVDHAHLAYLVRNSSKEIHELQLRPVAAGTTDEDLRIYFSQLAAGGQPASPFTGPATGFGAISPERSASIQAHGLQPGSYALLCLVPDEQLGFSHSFQGMHKIVTLQ
ncbi:hypothetical protein P3T36_002373 [Kitasatospora sp. MAP12-15]|uniref:hypothetical protein n=1 Tax=unclassified Kitasatospora TaxID=2633591 RepID=UPI00247381F0|nr:hypothetical protein [Kitasatospora sp. MAP12-44]MDH6108706.1 hypothetical protein [Kitasatospora sp. MAP12-44]